MCAESADTEAVCKEKECCEDVGHFIILYMIIYGLSIGGTWGRGCYGRVVVFLVVVFRAGLVCLRRTVTMILVSHAFLLGVLVWC